MLSEEGDMTIWHPAASSGHLRSDKLKTNTCDVFCCRQKTRPNSHAHASVRTSTANQTVNLLNSPERRALQPATEITQQLRNLTSAHTKLVVKPTHSPVRLDNTDQSRARTSIFRVLTKHRQLVIGVRYLETDYSATMNWALLQCSVLNLYHETMCVCLW